MSDRKISMINIETFIPSQSYKRFLREGQLKLSTRQKAKLIYISHNAFEDKWAAYRDLIASDQSESPLREILACIVDYEEKFVKAELGERLDKVYTLEVCDPENDFQWETIGIYASLRTAERIGRKTSHEFMIRRHCIRPLTEDEIICMEDKIAKDGYPEETDEQCLYYGADGRLRNLDRMYHEGESNDPEYDAYADAAAYVENIFADFPLCFQNGDVIKALDNGRGPRNVYGIIHVFSDREEQNDRILRIAGCSPDDVELVEFMDEGGEFGHEHIPITELEKADWDELPKDKQLVLQCAADLIRGRGTIDALQYSILRMKKNRVRQDD